MSGKEVSDINYLTNERKVVCILPEYSMYEFELAPNGYARDLIECLVTWAEADESKEREVIVSDGCYLDKDDHRVIHFDGETYTFSTEEKAIDYVRRAIETRKYGFLNYQVNVKPCEERRFDNYSATFGFNTKQYWLYNDDRHELMDVPTDVLNELREKFDNDSFEAVCYLDKLVSEEHPDWLNDVEYIYDGDMDI